MNKVIKRGLYDCLGRQLNYLPVIDFSRLLVYLRIGNDPNPDKPERIATKSRRHKEKLFVTS
jgi:hypothetical protein